MRFSVSTVQCVKSVGLLKVHERTFGRGKTLSRSGMPYLDEAGCVCGVVNLHVSAFVYGDVHKHPASRRLLAAPAVERSLGRYRKQVAELRIVSSAVSVWRTSYPPRVERTLLKIIVVICDSNTIGTSCNPFVAAHVARNTRCDNIIVNTIILTLTEPSAQPSAICAPSSENRVASTSDDRRRTLRTESALLGTCYIPMCPLNLQPYPDDGPETLRLAIVKIERGKMSFCIALSQICTTPQLDPG